MNGSVPARWWSRSSAHRTAGPVVMVRPVAGQIDDLQGEIQARVARNERCW